MKYSIFSLLFGFVIWLIGTIIFRFWGADFFQTDSLIVMLAFYVLCIPILYLMVQFVFNRFQLKDAERLKSAVLMVIPGMLLDTFCVAFHPVVFPEITSRQAVILGSILLWMYLVVLLAGILAKTTTGPFYQKGSF